MLLLAGITGSGRWIRASCEDRQASRGLVRRDPDPVASDCARAGSVATLPRGTGGRRAPPAGGVGTRMDGQPRTDHRPREPARRGLDRWRRRTAGGTVSGGAGSGRAGRPDCRLTGRAGCFARARGPRSGVAIYSEQMYAI